MCLKQRNTKSQGENIQQRDKRYKEKSNLNFRREK